MSLSRVAISLAATALLLSASAHARECARPLVAPPSGEEQVGIVIDRVGHPHFGEAERRCQYYWPYFAGRVAAPDGKPLRSEHCRLNVDALKLSDGYAPLGVFFRADVSKLQEAPQNYAWEIRGPLDQGPTPLIATFDSFNAAHVFDMPGKYEVALTTVLASGRKLKSAVQVNVWPRDRTTYHVDSDRGDDRFDGRAMEPAENCNPEGKAVGACSGPWKTATRAFGMLDPRDWRNKPASRYGTDSICQSQTRKQVFRYPDGDYTLYRSQAAHYPEALKDKSGRFLPPADSAVCEKLAPRMPSPLKPGDQILFKRGQTFDLETGIAALEQSRRTIDNQSLVFEKLTCTPLVMPGHWSMPLGILFGAYGSGKNPMIRNTGEASCMAFQLNGVGAMHLAFQDLDFDLETQRSAAPANRASFLMAPGNLLNLVLNRVSINRFDQGILFHNAHGVFIKDSRFHDSRVTHLYSETASDLAIIGNSFDFSGNHIAYTNASHALITRNSFKRHAFGRTALRVFGSGLDKPTESIWVSDNTFSGWIDPRTTADCIDGRRCQYADGKRFNYTLVELHPNNVDQDRFSRRVVFTRNVLLDAENLLKIAGVHDLSVTDNIFATADRSGTPRVLLTDYARRPSKDIRIDRNVLIETSAPASPASPQFELTEHGGRTDCTDGNAHERVVLSRNRILRSADGCSIRLTKGTPPQRSCLSSSDLKELAASPPSWLTLTANQVQQAGSPQMLAEELQKARARWRSNTAGSSASAK